MTKGQLQYEATNLQNEAREIRNEIARITLNIQIEKDNIESLKAYERTLDRQFKELGGWDAFE